MVNNLAAMLETQETPGREDPLEEGLAPHSSVLAWRAPWTEEPGGLQSMGLHRVRHHRATEHAYMQSRVGSSRKSLGNCTAGLGQDPGAEGSLPQSRLKTAGLFARLSLVQELRPKQRRVCHLRESQDLR